MLALAPALLAAVFLAACGASRDSRPAGPLSIQEALASEQTGPILVRGYLLADGATLRLCEALAESYPPQCGGPALEVIGAKLLEQRQLSKTSGAVTWSDAPVQLLGVVEDETITVSENAE
jgi:hypothetical protein